MSLLKERIGHFSCSDYFNCLQDMDANDRIDLMIDGQIPRSFSFSNSTSESNKSMVIFDNRFLSEEIVEMSGSFFNINNLFYEFKKTNFHEDPIISKYREYFHQMEHYNYATNDEEYGPILVSIRYLPENCLRHSIPNDVNYLVIIWSNKSNVFEMLNYNGIPKPYSLVKKYLYLNKKPLKKFKSASFPSASDIILDMDYSKFNKNFTFSVYLQLEGQTTENQMLGNISTSDELQELLDFIATKVKLLNFKNFNGGLDTRFGQTGKESYYTTEFNREIMFHVSTMITSNEESHEIINKKRCLNDHVAIIFKQSSMIFDVSGMSSENIHVYIVIEPIMVENSRCYKVIVLRKYCIPNFEPFNQFYFFKKDDHFRKFLLNKLINADIAANTTYNIEKRNFLLKKTVKSLSKMCSFLLSDDTTIHKATLFSKIKAISKSKTSGKSLEDDTENSAACGSN